RRHHGRLPHRRLGGDLHDQLLHQHAFPEERPRGPLGGRHPRVGDHLAAGEAQLRRGPRGPQLAAGAGHAARREEGQGMTSVALAVVAWTRYRHLRRITLPVTAVVVLLVIQILLGAVTVELRLPGDIVLVHLANALLLLAVLLYAAVQTFAAPAGGAVHTADP